MFFVTFETNGSRMNQNKKSRVNTCRWTNKNQLNVLICETLTANGRTKKISQKFSILQTWCVCSAQVWWLFSLLHQMHTYFFFFFFQSVFSLFNSRGRLQWNPKYYRKMRTSRTSHFSMYRMHALQCILFIYFCIGELWKPFNWSTYTFRPIQLKDTMPKKEAQHAALNERKEKKTKMIIMHLLRCSETH